MNRWQIVQPHYSHHLQFLLSGTVKKQGAESLEPGGKQDQDTGDLFLISTSLTDWLLQVLQFDLCWLVSFFSTGSTCPLPGNDSNRIKDMSTPATVLFLIGC